MDVGVGSGISIGSRACFACIRAVISLATSTAFRRGRLMP